MPNPTQPKNTFIPSKIGALRVANEDSDVIGSPSSPVAFAELEGLELDEAAMEVAALAVEDDLTVELAETLLCVLAALAEFATELPAAEVEAPAAIRFCWPILFNAIGRYNTIEKKRKEMKLDKAPSLR